MPTKERSQREDVQAIASMADALDKLCRVTNTEPARHDVRAAIEIVAKRVLAREQS